MAVNSLRSNKIRTFLTLLGIIIGVMSVTTIIALGEGVKRQVNQQINDLGSDLITVVPGRDTAISGYDSLRGTLGLISINGTPERSRPRGSIKARKHVSTPAVLCN
jgi:ABC-type lipoprotein release transport system permease subunit